MYNIHKITEEFETAICEYTGAPYAVAVDNASNALEICLKYLNVKDQVITIPSNTYPSVPAELVLSGNKVKFNELHPALRELTERERKYFINFYNRSGIDPQRLSELRMLTGEYQLDPLPIWDSALRFTSNMYREGQFQILSFTGQWKILKTCKGGAILTDNKYAVDWMRRYRFSGRRAKSYHEDYFDMVGKNYYLHPIFATMGLQFIDGFRNFDGTKIANKDISLPYPNLSKYPAYR